MKVDSCYDKKYGWVALLLLLLVSNSIWIVVSLEGNNLNFTIEEIFQLGTLIATTLALIVAIVYNILTIRESMLLRESQIAPDIVGDIIWYGPVAVALLMQNIGVGAATNVSLELELVSRNASVPSIKVSFKQPLLASHKTEEYCLNTFDVQQLEQNYVKVIGKVDCNDVAGKTHRFEWEVPFKGISMPPSGIFHVWNDPYEASHLAKKRNALLEQIVRKLP